MKNQMVTAIDSTQTHIEIIARVLTISSGKRWLVVSQKSTFIFYPQYIWLSKNTQNAMIIYVWIP
jgi:hypothetical protein